MPHGDHSSPLCLAFEATGKNQHRCLLKNPVWTSLRHLMLFLLWCPYFMVSVFFLEISNPLISFEGDKKVLLPFLSSSQAIYSWPPIPLYTILYGQSDFNLVVASLPMRTHNKTISVSCHLAFHSLLRLHFSKMKPGRSLKLRIGALWQSLAPQRSCLALLSRFLTRF